MLYFFIAIDILYHICIYGISCVEASTDELNYSNLSSADNAFETKCDIFKIHCLMINEFWCSDWFLKNYDIDH